MRERKDEKTEGLGRQDAVKLKFMEAFECGRERREEMESEGGRGMGGAQVDHKLSIRSAPWRSSLSICQEMRAEQQAAPTFHRVHEVRGMSSWKTNPSGPVSFTSSGGYTSSSFKFKGTLFGASKALEARVQFLSAQSAKCLTAGAFKSWTDTKPIRIIEG